MNRHLSTEQISQWTLGEYSIEVEQHLADCSSCRGELALFKTTLGLFRESAHSWADQNCAGPTQTIRRIKQAPYKSASMTFCLAAVMLLVSFFAGSLNRQKSVVMASADSDSALLQRVNAQVSQDVPSSLAPLDSFVSWEGARR